MTVKELVQICNITDAGNGKLRIYNENMGRKHLAEIKARKPEILAFLSEQKVSEERARKEREEKISAIPGLKELEAAIKEHEDYKSAFYRMMDDEYNDGANPPAMPKSNIDDLSSKYPRAAAYIKAVAYSYASHYAKSAAGRKAVERIINGEDHEKVLAEMEAEWLAYCENSIWN